mmetsp:Transcript_128761/g.400613  ORF Transcript_128761/g.400613 Transcript_128761/m.400613 type:complete len:291 (-) Transcript_128761:36-908(-)
MHVGIARVEEAAVVGEVLHRELLAIEEHLAALDTGAGDVVDALPHKVSSVCLKLGHAKLFEVRPELHAGEGLPGVLLYLRLALPAHVAGPLLPVQLPTTRRLHDEAGAENVREFRAEAVAAAGDLLLRVIVVVAGEQVAEHELRHVDLVLLVYLDRKALAVVPHLYPLLLGVDFHLDGGHVLVPLQVVGGVHEDLVEDLVEGRDVADLAGLHGLVVRIPHPELVILLLNGADIRVGPEQDVLHLRLLLVDLLNRFAPLELAALLAAPALQGRLLDLDDPLALARRHRVGP